MERLGGAVKKRNIRESNPDSAAHDLVTLLTELPQLLDEREMNQRIIKGSKNNEWKKGGVVVTECSIFNIPNWARHVACPGGYPEHVCASQHKHRRWILLTFLRN
jgi:hypothetical protein